MRCSGLLFLVVANSLVMTLIGLVAFALGYPEAMAIPLIMQNVFPLTAAFMCWRWEREEQVQEEEQARNSL